MPIVSNIKQITHFIVAGKLTGRRIEIQPHIKRLSAILPIHKSAFEALNTPAIAGFLKEKTDGELQKIRNWENIHLSLAKPFLDVNLEPRAVSVQQNGKAVIIRVLADKNVPLTTGEELPLVFNGIEYPFHLAKTIETKGAVPITTPPVTPPVPEIKLIGRAASSYIGIGVAYVPTRVDVSKFPSSDISPEEVEREVKGAREAFKTVRDKLNNSKPKNGDKDGTSISSNNGLAEMISDVFEAIARDTLARIAEKNENFKKALEQTINPVIKFYEECKDEKSMHDAEGLKDTFAALVLTRYAQMPDLLAGVESVSNRHNGDKVLVVCKNIEYLEVNSLNPLKIDGVIEEIGGQRSHATITCRSNGIASVVKLDGAREKIKNGDRVIVDGEKGIVIINPTKKTLGKYLALKKESEEIREHLRKKYMNKTVRTMDGIEIAIKGNSQSIEETERLNHEGIRDIGLFRSEAFLGIKISNGSIEKRDSEPSQEELIDFYCGNYVTSDGKKMKIVIRTMDVNGEDKEIVYLGKPQSEPGHTKEGLELTLDEGNNKPYYDLFKKHVKPMLQAAKRMAVEAIIEFPTVKSVQQFEEAKAVVAKTMDEMKEDKKIFEPNVKYYSMVEVPAIINEIDELANVADGLSLGTNDLVAKTLFEDRYNATTKFDELDPKILAMISRTVVAAKKHGKPLLICGVMASDPLCVPVLLGLGIRELSVDASSPNIIKSLVSNIDIKTCERLVSELADIRTDEEARKHVATFIWRRWKHGDAEHGDWKELSELEAILKKYINLEDGTLCNQET